MRPRPRLSNPFPGAAIVVLLVLASAGLARAANLPLSAVSSRNQKPAVQEGTTAQDGAPSEPAPQETAPEASAPEAGADRVAECDEAAGASIDSTGETARNSTSNVGAASAPEKAPLDQAIATVLANCTKNPQAPGLPNALRHLAANRERIAANEARRAERRTAREAAKSAARAALETERARRRAARDEAKSERRAAKGAEPPRGGLETGSHGGGKSRGHGKGLGG